MKINENTKLTLTIGQLKRLVKESIENETLASELEAADIIASKIFNDEKNKPRAIYTVDVHGSDIAPFVRLVHRVMSNTEDPVRYEKLKSKGAGMKVCGQYVEPFNNSDGHWNRWLQENPIDYISAVCRTIYAILFNYPEKYSRSKSGDVGAMLMGFPGAGATFVPKNAGSTVLIANIGESSVQKDILVAIYNPKNHEKDYFFIEVKSSNAGSRLSNAEVFKIKGSFENPKIDYSSAESAEFDTATDEIIDGKKVESPMVSDKVISSCSSKLYRLFNGLSVKLVNAIRPKLYELVTTKSPNHISSFNINRIMRGGIGDFSDNTLYECFQQCDGWEKIYQDEIVPEIRRYIIDTNKTLYRGPANIPVQEFFDKTFPLCPLFLLNAANPNDAVAYRTGTTSFGGRPINLRGITQDNSKVGDQIQVQVRLRLKKSQIPTDRIISMDDFRICTQFDLVKTSKDTKTLIDAEGLGGCDDLF